MQVAVSALSSNFGLIGFAVLEIEQFSYFGIWLEIAYSRPLLGGFGAYFPQMTSPIVLTPKRHFLARKHVVWAIKRENRSTGSTWVQDRGKRTGQSKKSQRRYISPIWGEARTEPIFTKICTVVAVPDVITCANFWAEIFRGYDFTGGRISRFPIDSFMGLTTVQRYCAACDKGTAAEHIGVSPAARGGRLSKPNESSDRSSTRWLKLCLFNFVGFTCLSFRIWLFIFSLWVPWPSD